VRRNLLSCAVAALVFAVSPGAYAASFIVPTDRELVDLAKAIVIATAVSSYPVHTSDGFIDTVNEFRVDEVIKGDAPKDKDVYRAAKEANWARVVAFRLPRNGV